MKQAAKNRREPAIVRHLVMPGLEVARAEARPRETVTAFLRRTGWATRDRKYGWQFRKGLPTILEINGEAVLRRDWRRRRIGARAEVRFVSYPLGAMAGQADLGSGVAHCDLGLRVLGRSDRCRGAWRRRARRGRLGDRPAASRRACSASAARWSSMH
jgi:hypothetical protein